MTLQPPQSRKLHMLDSTLARLRLLIVVVILATYGYLVTAEFLSWDDWFNLWKNPWLNPPTLATLGHYWRHSAYGLYIPTTYTVWTAVAAMGYVQQADAAGSHLNPYLFHATNILVHLAATLIVFEIFLKLKLPTAAAVIGALLFGLHPLQVESIAWTAGLKDVLAGMLGLAAGLLYLQAISTERKAPAFYTIAVIVFVAAILAKPSAVVIAPILLVIDALLLRRSWQIIIRWTAPFLMLAIVGAISAKIVQPAVGVTPAPLWQRPLIVADSTAFYLGKIVWPASFGVDYGRTPRNIFASGAARWTWIVPLLSVGVLLRVGDRRLWAGALIFLIALAPTSGWLTFLFQYYTTVADHYTYLPLFGIALIASQLVDRLGRRAITVAITLLVLLAARSIWQTTYWQNDQTLFRHALAVNPRSFMACDNLAQSLLNAGDSAAAEVFLRRAVSIKPDDLPAQTRLAELCEVQQNFVEAIEHRRAAVQTLLARPAELRVDLLPNLTALTADLLETKQLHEARYYHELAERYDLNDQRVMENRRLLAEPLR